MLLTLAGKVPTLDLPDTVKHTAADGPVTTEPIAPTTPPPPASESEPERTDAPTPPPPPSETPEQSTVETDADGLPWDHRIHASTKTKTKDGRWKRKRGVDPDTVTDVEADLRALMGAEVPEQAATPDAALDNLESIMQGNTPPPPASNDAEPAPEDFPSFLKAITALISEGKTDTDRINGVLGTFGIASLPLVASRTDMIPHLWEAINNG